MNCISNYKPYTGARQATWRILSLCLVVFIGFRGIALAEGTKQLEPLGAPSNSVCKLVLSQNLADNRIPFALLDCDPVYRLNIHISDHTSENIYLGFGNMVDYFNESVIYTDVRYRIKDPAGMIADGFPLSILPRTVGNIGFINTRNQAEAGPKINGGNPGGYDPLVLDPKMNGDYIIEFQLPALPVNALRVFKYIDITVAKANNPVTGRLWSKAWQLGSGSVSSDVSASYSLFYIYTGDSIVTRFDCNGLAGGVWTIYSNEWGCSTTGTWSERRRSIPGNASVIPQHKIYLNDPDPIAFPSGHIGKMIDFKILKEECDTVITFATHVSKSGNIEIMLDAPPSNPGSVGPEDVQLGYNVTAGYNVLLPAWDGKNKFGVPIGNGTEINARISFLNGLSNVPLYDVEDSPQGFKVDIQRPAVAGSTKLKLFWDDTQLAARYFPTSNITTGCLYTGTGVQTGCHRWTRDQGLGDTNTINTWWYLTTDQVLDVPVTLKIRPSSGSITGPVNICDGQKVSFRTLSIPYAREYIWHLSGPGVYDEVKTNAPDTVFTYGFPVSWPQGYYTVSVFGRNPQCFDGEKVFYPSFVHNPPEADFSYSYPCQGAEITFTDQSTPSDAMLDKFTWTVNSVAGNKPVFSGNPAVFVFDSLANYTVRLIVSDLFGCIDSVDRIIATEPKPKTNFEYTVDPNTKGELHFANKTTGASGYFWDFGNTMSSFLAEPVVKYNLEGNYTIRLVASSMDGCSDTLTKQYYYMPGLWLPNAFTPDRNGNNDFFRPVTQRNTLDPYQLIVFDRWGQMIFKTTNPSEGWDGKYKGEPCQAGNYSYIIQYREDKIESTGIVTKRGMVSLIR